ncbi:hypothetical protein [Paenibacillus sp. NRS-1781]|uniref:hypothetical protein n=1 Tax=Paenibacillus sp. NRS-1781 TaxID=3233905 RepID=UPI003D27AB22
MKTFKIRIITKFNTKNELFIPGEVHEARRLSYDFMDFKTPFQIVSGKKSGEEVPFKYAIVGPDKHQPTQQQFDRLSQQNAELLDELEQINAAVGKYDGQLVDAVRKLVQDKSELLQTVERHTDEQLNSEKLLQRIRELETIANERDEMIKSIKSVSVVIRDKRNPVEVPRDVAKAIDGYRWNGVDNDEIMRHLAIGIKGPNVDVLRSYVLEGGNGHNLLRALLNGYTTVSEQDDAAAMLESVTTLVQKWYHSPATDNGVEVLSQQICDFIRERETAASEAVTI